MKKIFLSFLLIIASICSQAKLVSVDDSILTENQKYMLNVDNNVHAVGQYVGLGKEIGLAINDGLAAFTDQTNKFANTKVGTWTALIITYKIIGKDALKIVIGIPLFFIILIILCWQFNAGYFTKRVRIKGNIFSTIMGTAEYKVIEPDSSMKIAALTILIVGLAIDVIILCCIMFS